AAPCPRAGRGGGLRLAALRPAPPPGTRMEQAVLGLAARGHALLAAGRPAPGSGLAALRAFDPAAGAGGGETDVLLAGPRAAPAAGWTALLGARAVGLSLDARARAAWGLVHRC